MSAKREIALNSLELLRRTELMRFIKLFGYLIMRTTLRLGLIQSTSYKHKHAWVRSISATKKKELQEDAKTLHNVSIVNERILPRIRRENSRPLYSKYKTGISQSTGLTPLRHKNLFMSSAIQWNRCFEFHGFQYTIGLLYIVQYLS